MPYICFGQKIYYSVLSPGKIQETDINGSYINTIYSTGNSIYAIEIDNINNEIYWSEQQTSNNSSKIYKSSLDSIVPQLVVNISFAYASDIYLSDNNLLYWASHYNTLGQSGGIYNNLNGTENLVIPAS